MGVSHADLETDRNRRGIVEPRRPAWFQQVSRTAFAAKGALYLILAAIMVRADLSNPSAFSRALIAGLGFALVFSSAYKIAEAVGHPDLDQRNRADAIVMRITRVLVSLVYAGLAVMAFAEAAHPTPLEGVHWTARLLEEPSGPLLAATTGAFAIGFGVHQFYRALSADCLRRLDCARMSQAAQRRAVIAAGIAYVGRGIVFGAVGLFLIEAAVNFDPRTSPLGLPGDLEALHQTAQWAFALVAAAMAAYGLFCLLVLARYANLGPQGEARPLQTSEGR